MADKGKLPKRWEQEKKSVRAFQMAFDVGEDVHYLIRHEALEQGINPSDRIRQILGLPVTKKPQRPRLSISLSDGDFELLAERFGLAVEDRLEIRQMAAEQLIQHLADRQRSTE